MNPEVWKWTKSTLIAVLGGGITAAVAAAMDPAKWRFPQDLGSGKLLPFFFDGAIAVFIGLLIKSPLGQKAMASFQAGQNQAPKAEIKPENKGKTP